MNRVKTQFWICLLLDLGTAIPEAIARCRGALRLQPDFPDAREALKSWTGGMDQRHELT